MSNDKCPNCGAKSWDYMRRYNRLYSCGRYESYNNVDCEGEPVSVKEGETCLRNQLAQANAEIERMRPVAEAALLAHYGMLFVGGGAGLSFKDILRVIDAVGEYEQQLQEAKNV